jgi:FAD/FMN-containing dehydrogenase
VSAGQVAWVEGFADAVGPFGAREPSEQWLALKRRYDPGGVFRA